MDQTVQILMTMDDPILHSCIQLYSSLPLELPLDSDCFKKRDIFLLRYVSREIPSLALATLGQPPTVHAAHT